LGSTTTTTTTTTAAAAAADSGVVTIPTTPHLMTEALEEVLHSPINNRGKEKRGMKEDDSDRGE